MASKTVLTLHSFWSYFSGILFNEATKSIEVFGLFFAYKRIHNCSNESWIQGCVFLKTGGLGINT